MLIEEQKTDIFSMHKNVTLNNKMYKVSFTRENSDKSRYVRINGVLTDYKINSTDVENMTPKFKEQLKSAINQYEADQDRSKNYLAWDGKLD